MHIGPTNVSYVIVGSVGKLLNSGNLQNATMETCAQRIYGGLSHSDSYHSRQICTTSMLSFTLLFPVFLQLSQ